MRWKLILLISYSYMNLDLADEWSLRERATKAVEDLLPTIERHFKGIKKGLVRRGMANKA
jgi:hypothetical protein